MHHMTTNLIYQWPPQLVPGTDYLISVVMEWCSVSIATCLWVVITLHSFIQLAVTTGSHTCATVRGRSGASITLQTHLKGITLSLSLLTATASLPSKCHENSMSDHISFHGSLCEIIMNFVQHGSSAWFVITPAQYSDMHCSKLFRIFIATFRWCCDHLHWPRKYQSGANYFPSEFHIKCNIKE